MTSSIYSGNRVHPLVRVVAGVLLLVMAAFAGAMIVALVRATWAGVRGQHFEWKGFVVAPVLLFGIWRLGKILFSAAWTGQHPRRAAEGDDTAAMIRGSR
jgi:ABC-type uncharacterized transport system permease subunit